MILKPITPKLFTLLYPILDHRKDITKSNRSLLVFIYIGYNSITVTSLSPF